MNILFVIGFLALIGWNIFIMLYYGKKLSELLDRLMSRNYSEYVTMKKVETTPPENPQPENKPEIDLSVFEEDWAEGENK